MNISRINGKPLTGPVQINYLVALLESRKVKPLPQKLS
jgi:hypothetical protein